MAWFFLIVGGILEVGWALGLSYSDGFTNIKVVIPTMIMLVVSFYFFAKALKYIPISTAYAVFTGLGSFGTAVVGMMFLGDSVSVIKIVLVLTLISCIMGLKFVSNQPTGEENV
ncbi:DMT family transporter [Lysinibacillus piscis]|uniref:QacE family quaternary ammonium compound efflux SMR transporter n=1 Tax=Lysinibacillus piscis TaxID=2518931 RepID=A0ABQ5NL30_9BACI|nr:multidrug efflux SMR transporter [Lysinibacillus sp. KH24]GLC89012.1 QacE family quaternary ammonium compound efflux SMR transporter [Lysinibacillus sp. KH24]